MKPDTFGALVRRKREVKEYGLREFARMIDVSPTYLSKIERGELDPPSEDKVKAIADRLDLDVDELMGLAGRVPEELAAIFQRQPRGMAAFLRSADGLSHERLQALAKLARRGGKT